MLQAAPRLLSRPARVHWAGFESDTLRLQQAGWEIAAEEDIMRDRITLMLRHRDMKLYALTRTEEFRYRAQRNYYEDLPLHFNVAWAAPNIAVRQIASAMPAFENFRQIDAQPQFVTEQIKSIEDFRIFATPLARTEEIIVEPQTVSAMLEKIREMQVPEQERIRQRERLADARERYEARPRQQFHAQILSFARAAA